MMTALIEAGIGQSPLWPLVVLALCIALVVLLIGVVKLHAFLALILAAVTAGLLSPIGSLPGEPAKSHWVQAVELTTTELGNTAGKIGLVIALASLIGMTLSESGAADKVVRRCLAVFGEKRAGAALLVSSYILSIPIFFDTFFVLLAPLARALALRTGRNYVLYVMVIAGGAMITHSYVPPHPGPLAMAEVLKVDVGFSIVFGLLFGIGPLIVAWLVAKRLDRRIDVPVRPLGPGDEAGARRLIDTPESELPSFFASIAPVVGPVILTSLASATSTMHGWQAAHPRWFHALELIGNRNVALLVGAALGTIVLARHKRLGMREVSQRMTAPLQVAGIIILIVSAGGAFGFMLRNAGVGNAILHLVKGRSINLVLLSWLVAATIRIAQGSATVAMITTASMMQPILEASGALPFHPVYIFIAIGSGAMILSWMNDAGFWVVCAMAGFTERETLRTFTVLITAASVAALVLALVFSRLVPLVP